MSLPYNENKLLVWQSGCEMQRRLYRYFAKNGAYIDVKRTGLGNIWGTKGPYVWRVTYHGPRGAYEPLKKGYLTLKQAKLAALKRITKSQPTKKTQQKWSNRLCEALQWHCLPHTYVAPPLSTWLADAGRKSFAVTYRIGGLQGKLQRVLLVESITWRKNRPVQRWQCEETGKYFEGQTAVIEYATSRANKF